MNYLAMFDSDWVRCCDLDGKPRLVTITKCEAGEIRNVSKKSRKPILHFKEFPKPLALNKTNGKAIAALFSPETEQWKGKQIVLYPARTTFGSEEVDCIRVRGPKVKGQEAATASPAEREPGQEG